MNNFNSKILILNLFFYNCRKVIFDAHIDELEDTPLPEDRPGGFNWGQIPNIQ
jgi:hypothetical protein